VTYPGAIASESVKDTGRDTRLAMDWPVSAAFASRVVVGHAIDLGALPEILPALPAIRKELDRVQTLAGTGNASSSCGAGVPRDGAGQDHVF
jgi:hypothetical protein